MLLQKKMEVKNQGQTGSYEDFTKYHAVIKKSTLYRKLEGKPQIVDPELNNRKDHTKRCIKVGRKIARKLGLNESLVSVSLRAHDLGHAAFGHPSEFVYEWFLQKFAGYPVQVACAHHNVQGAWMLFVHLKDIPAVVIDSVASHSGLYEYNPVDSEKSLTIETWLSSACQTPCSYEGVATKYADKISNAITDIIEARTAGFDVSEIWHIFEKFGTEEKLEDFLVDGLVLDAGGIWMKEEQYRVLKALQAFTYSSKVHKAPWLVKIRRGLKRDMARALVAVYYLLEQKNFTRYNNTRAGRIVEEFMEKRDKNYPSDVQICNKVRAKDIVTYLDDEDVRKMLSSVHEIAAGNKELAKLLNSIPAFA